MLTIIFGALAAFLLSAITFGTLCWIIYIILAPSLGLPGINILQAWGIFLIIRIIIDGSVKLTINENKRRFY